MAGNSSANVRASGGRQGIKCRYCGSSIEASATLCSKCGSYQAAWRNELRYWSGITGLATLIVSGIVVTYSFGSEIYRRFTQADVWVSEMQFFGQSSFWNRSAADILVTAIQIRSDHPSYDLLLHLDQIIETPEGNRMALSDMTEKKRPVPLRVNLSKLTNVEWHGTNADTFNSDRVGDYVQNLTESELNLVKSNDVVVSSKYVPEFMLLHGAQYDQLFASKILNLTSFSANCSLAYLKFGAAYYAEFPCVGVLRERKP
ncbi:hypothetical protein U8Q07_14980 [Rhizobium ruizarguesonis]|nr:hypothetical protein U8Q07_14980 [Rhizobium ruizarguesonis]